MSEKVGQHRLFTEIWCLGVFVAANKGSFKATQNAFGNRTSRIENLQSLWPDSNYLFMIGHVF